MDERAVVTCFLRHGPEVLLLRRSDTVSTHSGRWGGVSGFAEGAPDEAARWEIQEETGLLAAADPVRSGDPIAVVDGETRWRVHPYLFDCDSTDVDPNEEVAGFEWVQPPAVLDRETVPELWATYRAVAPSVETVRADEDHGSAYLSLRALEVLRDRAAEVAAGVGEGDGDGSGNGNGDGTADLAGLARDLRAVRPNMGVVGTRINRVMSEAGSEPGTDPAAVRDAATAACERAVRTDEEAAAATAEVVGDRVLTLSRSGTVLDALRATDPEAVFVTESRPAREGVGVARELAEGSEDGETGEDDADLDVTLYVDAAMGHVVPEESVDTVLVGADAVLADGAVVNKVGTRLAALAAREAGIDCYAVCSRDKVIPEESVDLEEGPPEAVHERSAPFEVRNPVFELTPPDLVTGVVTEDGVLDADDVAAVAEDHAELARWGD